ncbi:Pirin domain protein [Paenibacillus curdlanolyticus YK9]|uniref:Pirin domain protein n=1 Tax=Paenibacillus curdlanolyticus YK9 TaxID=717606 RepID=E0IBC5_9BACL|nr:pirin family protein [Paenibacillus curdlanolyticus]EFM10005.1 Pirin domain protein [Paenibacillus curdlanolyticus YK9]
MIQTFAANQRYHTNHGWLDSYFSFSFADYYDPNNLQFGPMRVLNDDRIDGGTGFGMHPHREMEIVSLVLSGQLEHRDNMGNQAVTTWGGIQRMSAGTGVHHSEKNPSPSEPVELLQMWFLPAERGIAPSYETSSFDPNELSGKLVPIVSGNAELQQPGRVAKIHQDMTMYLTELSGGQSVTFEQQPGRKQFVFVLAGSVSLEGGSEQAELHRRDSARIEGITSLKLTSSDTAAQVLLIDLP